MTKHGDTAYFPGTGPQEHQCSDCIYWHAPHSAGRCRKAAEMRGTGVMKLEPIASNTPSCKYFSVREGLTAAEMM